jgi:ribose 5-phosphate isomerase B
MNDDEPTSVTNSVPVPPDGVHPMVFLAADHAGYALKTMLVEHLSLLGYPTEDLGAKELDQEDDYPDFITPLAHKVAATPGSFGVICGGSGQGEAMAANRVPGARAAVYYGQMPVTDSLDKEGARSEDGFDAVRLPRRHNDANILSIGARFVSPVEADKAVRIFLATKFSEEERHARRLGKF